MPKTVREVNYWWLIGVLSFSIIVLLTANLGGIPNVVDYINFAATISSLVLAIVAIIYSMYANFSSVTTFTQLTDSAKQITNVTNELSIVAGRLESRADELPIAVNSLRVQMDRYFGSSPAHRQAGQAPDHVVKALVESARYGPLTSLYILKLAYQRPDKSLDLWGEAAFGAELPTFLLASTSTMLFMASWTGMANYSDNAPDALTIDYLHPVILEMVDETRLLAAYVGDAQQMERATSELELIRKIFG
jgi:hypothetical protein